VTTAHGVQLDLQEGFLRDEVVVTIDGHELSSARDVTTRTQLGLARSLHLAVPAGAVRLTVALPRLQLSEGVELPATRPLWVAATLNEARDRLTLQLSTERFGYV